MLANSPWARDQTVPIPIAGINSGAYGEKELYIKMTARFFSALPIRQAYVRMMELQNKYDDMTPDQREEFAKRFTRALKLDVSDRVIVAVEVDTNVPDWNRDLKTYFQNASVNTLKQNVYLITPKVGRIQAVEYYPPSADGTGAKFIFPRQVEGKPILSPDDKDVNIEYYLSTASISDKFVIRFDVNKMSYQDQLNY